MGDEPERRSPLKSRPLRQAGESVQEEILRVIDDDLTIYLFVAIVFVLLAGMEWLRLYLGNLQLHWHYTVIACVAVIVALRRREKLRSKVVQLRLGRDGERAVGQFLERMRERGYRVFHDIQQDHFNIDHVLVGPEGVYTVETKTRSFPKRGQPIVTYDGERVFVAGWEPDRDCIAQAKKQAFAIHQAILAETGSKIWVQPIVVFPGWKVQGPPEGVETDAWVLDPADLPARIADQQAELTPADLKAISSCIYSLSVGKG